MIIMNKLYKCALGLLTAFALSFACFSNAEKVESLINYINVGNATAGNSWLNLQSFSSPGTYCLYFEPTETYNTYLKWWIDSQPASVFLGVNPNTRGCMTTPNSNTNLYVQKEGYGTVNFNFKIYENGTLLNTDIPVYSSMQCQTEYNLIPISEVTANYCRLNFDLIDPQECPINQGTGAIVRSNLMINDVPYAQNQNINVFIPDFLSWNLSFNDLYTVIEVEGYNADEEYIENVIKQEKLTPTNEDIEEMITGFMTNYFPYLALAIIFLYLARKIFKLFK